MEYSTIWMPTETNYCMKREITKDTIMSNGKTYFEIRETRTDTLPEKFTYERIDSIKGKIYLFDESFVGDKEYLIECLSMGTSETINTWDKHGDEFWEKNITFCENILLEIFENGKVVLDSKRYESNSDEWKEYYLSKGIGKSYQYGGTIDGYDVTFNLVATKINDVFYGDSTVVGITDRNSKIPMNFSLSQNYPNPFNPTTTIKYEIPTLKNLNNVSLKVYDILGKEVTTLVNKQQKSGSYEVNFDASKLSSGVYYYQLKSGDFIETKKMIYLQ
ncbi:MAG: T9SS type A sorting domain-containing protein [Ignavibacteriae bacterium]|nr:T9SS type A sorting domain-containing protein [Ignavibacteriota bacterium]